MMHEHPDHPDAEHLESGNYWCRDCQCEYTPDGTITYQEPTAAQLEAMNNPDSGPSVAHYRESMRDAGRGYLLRD